jgi:hypothetical protein
MAYNINETFQFETPNIKEMVREFNESATKTKKKSGLIIEIAAIHVGATKNANYYSEDALHEGVHSWTSPFQKPIIKNHDLMTEPLGRVIGSSVATTEDGVPYIKIQAAITDPVAIEKVLDGRYLTGSIGATAQEAICSICDTDWAKESDQPGLPCKHRFGAAYEGKTAYRSLGGLNFHEYSFVNAPSDQNSVVQSVGEKVNTFSFTPRVFELNFEKAEIEEYDLTEGYATVVETSRPEFLQLKGAFILAESTKKVAFVDEGTTNTEDSTNIGENNMSKDVNDTTDVVEEEDEDILDVIDAASAAEEDEGGDDHDDTHDDSDADKADDDQEEVHGNDLVDADDEQHDGDAPHEGDETDTTVDSDADDDDTTDTEEAASKDDDDTKDDDEEDDEDKKDDADSVSGDDIRKDGKLIAPGNRMGKTREGEEDVEDKADETESDKVADAELAEKDSDEPTVAELQEKIQALEARVTKLTKALHNSIVERIVDAKIVRGLVTEDAVVEHSTRKASSLMDTLKDLKSIPLQGIDLAELQARFQPGVAGVAEDNVEDEEVEEVHVPPADPKKELEGLFADVLLGRTNLH